MSFSVSSMYNASFNSQGFLELFDGGFGQPAPAGAVESTTHHYPGSGNSLIILSGATVQKCEIAIGATSSDMDTLKGMEGEEHTLTYSAGTFTATLLQVRDRRKGGTGSGGEKATLEFVLT